MNGDITFADRVHEVRSGSTHAVSRMEDPFSGCRQRRTEDLLMVNGMCTRARQGRVELQISPTKAPILECRRRPVQRLVGERRRRNHRAVGFGLRRGRSGLGDLDKDGSPEVVMNHLDKRRSLPKNFVTKRNWLLIPCVGTTANRDGDRDTYVRLCGQPLNLRRDSDRIELPPAE
jgi:hypothetical protein